MIDRSPTIAILAPGEMGAAVAELLQSKGLRIVTTLQGRADRTAIRCRQAGLIVLDSLEAVARESNIVISLVPPDAAEIIALGYAAFAAIIPARALFIDANSIRPDSIAKIAGVLNAAGIEFLDASINGLAKNLRTGGTLFLSGLRADEIARLFGDAMRVKILGAEPGRASAMKMLLGGLSKGTCALFLELSIVAQRQGILPEMLEATASIYPGIHALIDRMLPTYTHHAQRRAVEMSELTAMTLSNNIQPGIIKAIHHLHSQLAELLVNQNIPDPTTATLIEQLGSKDFLKIET